MATTIKKTPYAPHPAYHPSARNYQSPRPAPRVKPEAEESYKKHHGHMEKWLDSRYNTAYNSPRPLGRCPSPEAKALRSSHEKGSIGNLLGTASYPPPPNTHRAPRVRPEAEEIAQSQTGKGMANLLHSYGKLPMSARSPPRVKPEAEEIASSHTGKPVSNLLHSYGKLPMSARPAPRVPDESVDNAELDRGKRMKRLVNNYGKNPTTPRNPPRVKPEAEDIAHHATGHMAQRLLQPQLGTPRRPRTTTGYHSSPRETPRSSRSGAASDRYYHKRSATAAW